MNKTTKIIIAVVAILIVVAVVVAAIVLNGNKSKSNLNISTTEDMENLVNQIYAGTEMPLKSLMTTVVDMSQQDMITNATGLTSADKLDAVVVSEPMMSSQAYSMVLVKVKDAKDADSVAKEMNEKINARKWICVAAEKVYTTSSGNIVCLVMSSEEWGKPVYNEFKKLAGNVGEEYLREPEEGMFDDGMFDEDMGGNGTPITAM